MPQTILTIKANAVLCALLLAVPARASTCAVPKGGSSALGLRDVEERLRFLEDHLAAEERAAGVWLRDWTVVLAGLTVGPLLLASQSKDSGRREDLIFGAVTSAATIGAIYLMPPPAFHRTAEGPPSNACARLAALERRTERTAAEELAGKSARAHVNTFLINLGVAVVGLGTGLGRWQSAILGSFSGTVTGETMLLTQPRGLDIPWREYLSGRFGERRAAVVFEAPKVAPVGNGGLGLFWQLRF